MGLNAKNSKTQWLQFNLVNIKSKNTVMFSPKANLICSFILLSLCYSLSGQILSDYKVEKLQKDFEVFKTTLLEHTGDPYLHCSEEKLHHAFDSIESTLSEPKNQWEYFRDLCYITSLMSDGHTQVLPTKDLFKAFFSLPTSIDADLQYINGQLFVRSSFGRKPRILKGSVITKINGESIDEVARSIYNYTSSDGTNTTMKDALAKELFLFYYFIAYGVPEAFELEVVSKENDTLHTTIMPTYPDGKKMSKHIKGHPIFDPENPEEFGNTYVSRRYNYAALTFSTFSEAKGKRYHRWLDEQFQKIEKSEVENLVIDLRGNLGGYAQYMLLTYITGELETASNFYVGTTEFPKYKRHIKKMSKSYRLYKKQVRRARKGKENPMGDMVVSSSVFGKYSVHIKNIYVFVDGMSASASANLAAHLKAKKKAVIIGKETGGSYAGGNTGGLKMKLPHSKISWIVNPIQYDNKNELSLGDGGLPADYLIEYTPLKRVSKSRRRDPYYKQLLKLIKNDEMVSEKKNI